MAVEQAQLEAVFGQAVALSPGERAAYLDRACAQNPELRRQVEALLAAHESAGAFLQPANTVPATDPAAPRTADAAALLGSTIGRYRLLEVIGEGGMGVVYKAEQREPMHRLVALKLIRLGMDTQQVIARFNSERQALALMNHPNVAAVHDAGATATGRPYFVMELVRGVPITEYCDQLHLNIRQRLELFAQVCQAVQHAHQKGIIHRDLKPSNVLASTIDDRPVIKVIDFGIAKATDARSSEKTVFTEFRQMIGTPEYMSPEQAACSLDIDTRSDVYSLGVLLYELLAGATPFDPRELRSKAFGEMQRIIREVDPPMPSTRLSSHAALPSVAANRQLEPARLCRSVRGELDWIVMKAMEKDRLRRYESASAVAADVMHYLADEPTSAGAPSRIYGLRKFVRRNRGPVIAGALLASALVLGLAGTIWQAQRAADRARAAERARTAEQQARSRAEAINEFVKQALMSSDPHAGGRQDILVVDAMKSALQEIDRGAFTADPDTEAGLRATIAHILNGNGRPNEAEGPAARALQIAQQLHPGDHSLVAGSMANLAEVYTALGRLDEAESLLRQSVAMNQRLNKGDHTDAAGALGNLAIVLTHSGRTAEAEPLARQALEMRQRLYKGDELNVAQALNNLAGILLSQGRPVQAEPLYLQSLQMKQRLFKGDHPSVAMSLNNVAFVLEALGRAAEAEPLYAQALEMNQRLFKGDHPSVAIGLDNLANVRLVLGRGAEAEALQQQALEMNRRLFKGDHPDIATSLSNLANVRKSMGRAAEAELLYVQAVEMNQRLFKGDHPDLSASMEMLAHTRQSLGRPAEAEPLFLQALQMNQRLYKGDVPAVARSLNNLASVRRILGRDAEAEPLYQQAIQMLQRLFKDGHPDLVQCLNYLADCEDALGRHDEAMQHRREALAIQRRLAGTGPATTQSGQR